MRLVRRGIYSFPDKEWGGVSDEAKELVRQLLLVNPEKRLTASQGKENKEEQKGEGALLLFYFCLY